MLLMYTLWAFIISFFSIIILRPVALKIRLVDSPSERKNHTGNVPLVGGICIFISILITYLFFIEYDTFINFLILTSGLILLQGIWDDYGDLNAKIKLFFQILITLMMIYLTGIKLESLGHLFGFYHPIELGFLSVPITIIAVVGLTNAINMIDGFDGIAAFIIILAITGIISFNLNPEISPFISFLLVIVCSLLPFLTFNLINYKKIKVFLGDGGSLSLGYIISWALIYSTESINSFSPSFALWCVAIPLFDFFTVIILRIKKNNPLMVARRDHIHHVLVDIGFLKKYIVMLILSFGLILLLIGYIIEKYNQTLSFPVFLILFLLYLSIRLFKKN